MLKLDLRGVKLGCSVDAREIVNSPGREKKSENIATLHPFWFPFEELNKYGSYLSREFDNHKRGKMFPNVDRQICLFFWELVCRAPGDEDRFLRSADTQSAP